MSERTLHPTCEGLGCQNSARLIDQKRDAERILRLEQENRELREAGGLLSLKAETVRAEYSRALEVLEGFNRTQAARDLRGPIGGLAIANEVMRKLLDLATPPTRQESAREHVCEARKWLKSCPWCSEKMKGRAVGYQFLHVITCGDRRIAEAGRKREQQLGDLLARIHGDGGHYIADHGFEKAVEDADAIVVRWLTRDAEEAAASRPATAQAAYPPVDLMEAIKAGLKAREPEPPAGEEKP